LILAGVLNKKESIENNKLNKNENTENWEFLLKILKFDFKSSSILILFFLLTQVKSFMDTRPLRGERPGYVGLPGLP